MTSKTKRNIIFTMSIVFLMVSAIILLAISGVLHYSTYDASEIIQSEPPISLSDWRLVLVNPWNSLTDTFTP